MRIPTARIDPEKLQWTGEEVWMPAQRGDVILAPKAGHVARVGTTRNFGHSILIRHLDGTYSAFTHLDAPATLARDTYVAEGDAIGIVGIDGARGAVLVWRVHGASGAYVDPRSWLRTPSGMIVFAGVMALLLAGLLAVPDEPVRRGSMPL